MPTSYNNQMEHLPLPHVAPLGAHSRSSSGLRVARVGIRPRPREELCAAVQRIKAWREAEGGSIYNFRAFPEGDALLGHHALAVRRSREGVRAASKCIIPHPQLMQQQTHPLQSKGNIPPQPPPPPPELAFPST